MCRLSLIQSCSVMLEGMLCSSFLDPRRREAQDDNKEQSAATPVASVSCARTLLVDVSNFGCPDRLRAGRQYIVTSRAFKRKFRFSRQQLPEFNTRTAIRSEVNEFLQRLQHWRRACDEQPMTTMMTDFMGQAEYRLPPRRSLQKPWSLLNSSELGWGCLCAVTMSRACTLLSSGDCLELVRLYDLCRQIDPPWRERNHLRLRLSPTYPTL
nr:hypothetical protein CFP56_07773 [Quercus suber]